MLGHGWAVEALRRAVPDAEIGIVLDPWPIHPATGSPEDVAAAYAEDGVRNRWFFDPILRGAYPEDVLEHFADVAPPIRDGDLATISAPLDFFGVNYYSRRVVRAGADGNAIDVRPQGALTDMDWEVYPDAIRESLVRMHREYGVDSLYVTENGAAFTAVRGHGGHIHDVERLVYVDYPTLERVPKDSFYRYRDLIAANRAGAFSDQRLEATS